jgi:hypothetical protein
MKRRTWPLWLLRDVPALLGVMLSFWPLMIIVIANGRKAMLGRKIPQRVYDCIMQMLPIAEARLRYALARQAARALGWDPRRVQLETIPMPESWEATPERLEAYRLAMMDIAAAAQTFTDLIRQHYRIRTRVDANATHASTDAARRAVAQQERVGVASSRAGVSQAFILSSARSARPSKDERVLANARGPPPFPQTRQSTHPCPGARRFRERIRLSSPRQSSRSAGRGAPNRSNRNPGRANLPGLLQLLIVGQIS